MIRLLLTLNFLIFASIAHADIYETSDGYYYPQITSSEEFDRILVPTPDPSKDVRIDFVNSITKANVDSQSAPQFVFFAKGEFAQKLYIIAVNDDVFKTIYRARAVLARTTSILRSGNFLANLNLQNTGTFFDLLQMMHFKTLVLSDGETWAHKVTFLR